jgi:hypothetical protein
MSRTTLTADTITDQQIEALRKEANASGDMAQVVVCSVALGAAPEMMAHPMRLGARFQIEATGRAWSTVDARAECARVITEAAAQCD